MSDFMWFDRRYCVSCGYFSDAATKALHHANFLIVIKTVYFFAKICQINNLTFMCRAVWVYKANYVPKIIKKIRLSIIEAFFKLMSCILSALGQCRS